RAREARRIRTQPVPARPEARVAAHRRLRPLHDDHNGDADAADGARRPRLPAGADLADRVRVPDESARSAARRLTDAPGTLRRRGRVRGVSCGEGRPAHPVPLPRRAEPRALPERTGLAGEQAEAVAGGVRAAAGTDLADDA